MMLCLAVFSSLKCLKLLFATTKLIAVIRESFICSMVNGCRESMFRTWMDFTLPQSTRLVTIAILMEFGIIVCELMER